MREPARRLLCAALAAAGLLVSAAAARAEDVIAVAASGSLRQSGFLAYIDPLVKAGAKVSVQWKAAGSADVIRLARGCSVDAVFVDSPEAEEALMRDGVGALRFRVMKDAAGDQYSVIVLNPGACRAASFNPALRFLRWLTSQDGQAAIRRFSARGAAAYQPNAGTETCPACEARQ